MAEGAKRTPPVRFDTWEVKIEVATLRARRPPPLVYTGDGVGATRDVFVTRVGDDLLFDDSSLKEFVYAVADELAVGGELGFPVSDFRVRISPRLLRAAIRRLETHDVARLGENRGRLLRDGPRRITHEAPCGATHTFERRQLEQVLDAFS